MTDVHGFATRANARRRWRALLTVGLASAAGLLLMSAAGTATPATKVTHPVLFHVGTAVESINVPAGLPLYAGGYSLSPPITRQYSPLQVRAFYVSNGRSAVEFAVVDSQAEFAAYRGDPTVGITADRTDAAAEISDAHFGPAISPSDIIVQGSHSHSAPTLEGIWGPTPDAYLRLVHAQTVAALVAAARSARPAYLQYGQINAPQIADLTIADDTLPDWDVDGLISVLRAVNPRTGATEGMFVNVPAHPVTIDGAADKMLGDDYLAWLRDDLQRGLGGTAVVGPATLGRQEPPVQTTDVTQLRFYARMLYGLVSQALSRAHWLTDPTLAGTTQPLTVPATNAALLGLLAADALPPALKAEEAARTGIYPINRADTPPYQTGNVIGTYLTALRVGPLLYLSQPGEPYPEVRWTLARDIHGAAAVIALSKGQDDLGYYMPAWTYPFGVVDGTDHPIFNIAPQMGDQVITEDAAEASAVGFQAGPLPASLPAPRNFAAAVQPGLQALAATQAGDAGADGRFAPVLEAIYNQAVYDGHPAAGGVHWSFGDGTQATTGYLLTATGIRGGVGMFTHGFRPGAYTVRLSATDTAGATATWTIAIHAYPRLRAIIRRKPSGHGRFTLIAALSGGDGRLLAGSWQLGGHTVAGLTVFDARTAGERVCLTVTDGTGSRARTCSDRARSAAAGRRR